MKIKLNRTSHTIKPVSKLSFNEFNAIIIKAEISDLKEYLAAMINIPVKELMSAEMSGGSLSALHQQVFDVDVSAVIKDKKETLEYNGEILTTDSLSHATFGKNYFFDLYHQRQKQDKINFYELCIYALAIGINEGQDQSKVEEIYKGLAAQPWVNVLPQGFFLVKKYFGKKSNFLRWWLVFMMELKVIKWRTRRSRMNLIESEKM